MNVPSARWLAFVLLAGCGGGASASSVASLEAQVRQLRSEQERQSHQLEVLEHRVVLAEDSARLARQALTGVGARSTVRIEPDGAAVEPIPSPAVDGGGGAGDDGAGANDPEPPGGRPVVRAAGRERLPDAPAPPLPSAGGERLPVTPVPITPAPAGSGTRRHRRGAASDEQRDTTPGVIDASDVGAPASVTPVAPPANAPEDTTDDPASALPVSGPAIGTERVSSVRDPRAAPAYDHALALARGGQCPAALSALSEFLVRWPDHPFAANAMYWRGECILAAGDARRAAQEFEGLLARFPVGNKTPDALYKLAQCYTRLGELARARDARARLLRDFPRSDAAARALAERTRSP